MPGAAFACLLLFSRRDREQHEIRSQQAWVLPPMRRTIPVFAAITVLAGLTFGRTAVPRPMWVPDTAAPTLVDADFNRDGVGDRLVVDGTVVDVGLSHRCSSHVVLRHWTPVVRLVVSDIDFDGDTDVVTLTEAGRIWIWRNDGRGSFESERIERHPAPWRSLPGSVASQPSIIPDVAADSPPDRRPNVTSIAAVRLANPTRAGPAWSPLTPVGPCSRPASSASPRAPPLEALA
jgi:hypothetical protein